MASGDVFADTSALYAFVDRRDAFHIKAGEIVLGLVRARRRLVVSDYVIAEAVNLANARGGSPIARRLIDLIDQTAGIRIEWIGLARFEQAKAFFRKHSDHSYSFTDCTSFVLMRELKIKDALTTDRHFTEAGFRALLPSASNT
ncbi:MAG: PIN domain-containing protein [Verrucomicrobia bacterium]|nr:PIN domain-containing protein [Verrucomicrobiota bacterium]